ncbi:MAG: SpoIID/LytB domain-containing protein [Bacteroidia bacterium]|nr:SpoIID/LytB domain-containing protein [Bacteroidia bacterium]
MHTNENPECAYLLTVAERVSVILLFTMKWPLFILILLGLACSRLPAQEVRININPGRSLERVMYQPLGDQVVVYVGDSFPVPVVRMENLQRAELIAAGDVVKFRIGEQVFGPFPSVRFWLNDEAPRFNLEIPYRKDQYRTYPNDLEVRALDGRLQLINVANLENYVRGVIFAEAGHHQSLDFFKVQAVSARTYALAHKGKHGREGYDLCDQTHCQAYHGLAHSAPLIDQAVQETTHEVIVFGDNQLVEAVFSANCGGFTANSEDVWISEVEYLRSIPDFNFCEGFNNHAWHLVVTKWDFLQKLGEYHKTEALGFEVVPDVSGRVKKVLLNGDPKLVVSGEEVRRLFSLKSSRFHLYESGSLLMVEGAGFGHGVGMCQDGAYFLSESGMDYDRIIKHYYQGVQIVPLTGFTVPAN